jgi:steroid delta-isomerase-like uncharacterized protein
MKTLIAHMTAEARGDVSSVMETFGDNADFFEHAWGLHHAGRDGVRAYYNDALQAFADATGEVTRWHVTESTMVLEIAMTGTHTGTWHGVAPTGLQVSFPLCAIFVFDDQGYIASESTYYDRPTVMRQLGVRPLAS